MNWLTFFKELHLGYFRLVVGGGVDDLVEGATGEPAEGDAGGGGGGGRFVVDPGGGGGGSRVPYSPSPSMSLSVGAAAADSNSVRLLAYYVKVTNDAKTWPHPEVLDENRLRGTTALFVRAKDGTKRSTFEDFTAQDVWPWVMDLAVGSKGAIEIEARLDIPQHGEVVASNLRPGLYAVFVDSEKKDVGAGVEGKLHRLGPRSFEVRAGEPTLLLDYQETRTPAPLVIRGGTVGRDGVSKVLRLSLLKTAALPAVYE